MFGSFPPSPLVGLRLQSLLGPGSRHCLWNHYSHNPEGTCPGGLSGIVVGVNVCFNTYRARYNHADGERRLSLVDELDRAFARAGCPKHRALCDVWVRTALVIQQRVAWCPVEERSAYRTCRVPILTSPGGPTSTHSQRTRRCGAPGYPRSTIGSSPQA